MGGALEQAAIGAVTSGIDSVVGAYHDYKKGEVNLAGAVAKVVTGTALGAAFGAMGAEGMGEFKKSCELTKEAGSALKTVFHRSTVRRSVDRAAKKTLKKAGKYVLKTMKNAFIDGISSYGISYGATWYTGKYYTWATR